MITGREVLRHPATIVRCFGPAAYARCVRAALTGSPATFLEAIQPATRGCGLPRGRVWRAVVLSGLLVAAVSGMGVLLAHGSDTSGFACYPCYAAA